MTALARLDALLNNAEMNGKAEVAAVLKLLRDPVVKLKETAELVSVVGADALNARRALRICRDALNKAVSDVLSAGQYPVTRARSLRAVAQADRVLKTEIGT